MKYSRLKKDKKRGFVLLMVMLLIASLTFIVIGIMMQTYLARNVLSTLHKKNNQQKLFACGVELAKGLLAGTFEKMENGEAGENSTQDLENQKEGNQEEKSGEKETQEDNNEDKKKEALKTFFMYWNNVFKWKDFELKEESEGVEGKVSLLVMCEDGKVPLNKLIQQFKEQKKNSKKNNNKNEDNKNEKAEDSNKKKNENEEELDEKEDGGEDVNKKIMESDFFKGISEWFIQMKDKSDSLKSLSHDSQDTNSKDPGKNNNEKSIIEEFVFEYIKNNKNKEKMPQNIWQVVPENLRKKNCYAFPDIKNKQNATENGSYKIGDLLSTHNDGCNIMYASPALVQSLSENGFTLTDETRGKIIKAGSEIIKSKKGGSVEKVWDELFTKTCNIQYPKNMLKNVAVEKIFKFSTTPTVFTVLCRCEIDGTETLGILFVEKMVSCGKHNNKNYILKNLILL